MKNSIKHVDFLDHLRGVAIIIVLLWHTVIAVYGYDYAPWDGWLRSFSNTTISFFCYLAASFGQAGVPIFFVISGFCIHMSFHQQGQRWGSFFIRRFFRIYPAYLAALIFIALLLYEKHFPVFFESRAVWIQLLTHAFLVHNFNLWTMMGISGPLWSLAIEAQLYLVYPVLLFSAGKLGWCRTMVILAGCELLINATDALMHAPGSTNILGEQISWVLANSVLGYWFSWALGAFIADAYLQNLPLPFLKVPPFWCLALAISSFFFKALNPFWFLLFSTVVAAVVCQLLNGAGAKTIRVQSISLSVLKKAGLWSYSIYLLHVPLLNTYQYAIDWIIPEEYRPKPVEFMLMASTWLAIIPISFFWYKLIEIPGIAFGKQIIANKETCGRSVGMAENANRGVAAKHSLMIATLLVFVIGSIITSAIFIPPTPEENNNLAWSLATSSEASKRNGAEAVKLAENACQRTQYKVTIMVGTLAAAYAEAGRFDDAISTAQKACELAAENGETNLLQKNQALLKIYQGHQPYHASK